ncbi:hypothetical protein [Carboxylicivirga marina]|uniref:Curlin associated repeat-containing protein n=1 Tax=Carboxylicivirga marina TaxID=2800988 RepID=A0ABS1HH02_9BACT|nr:hypothetical protein [Carboxylicivirga marina]MBK3516953.1 hypothetical protein [Carboxylicivirga marina]
MKKVVFLLSMLVCAGLVMAQNSGNEADIEQYGSNIAEIEQTGSDNDADIIQGSLATPVTNNKVPTNAGDWKGGAFIEQIGDDNTASITMQGGGNNGSSIYQDGDDNEGHQDIGTSQTIGTSWDLMGLDLDQIGNNNMATQRTVRSFGSAGVKRMFVIQEGDYNVATQLSVGGYSNNQSITQTGNNNNNATVSGNVFDISATTLGNPLDLPFKMSNGSTDVSGDYTQYSNQMFGNAVINVTGDNNNTYQYQEYSVWSVSGRNDAWIDIIGDNNDVVQGQLGEYNDSDIDIDGNGNVVTTSQFGDSNIIDVDLVGGSTNCVVGIEQTGNSHSATVYQSGASNFAKIIQQ